jgi:hypothetical protein
MTTGKIIEESLDLYGIKTARNAAKYVAQARRKAGLPDADALAVAVWMRLARSAEDLEAAYCGH